MLRRTFLLMAATVASAVWTAPAFAELEVGTVTGKIVKVEAGKLTMIDNRGGGEFTLPVPDDAVVTFDGKEYDLTDLEAGATIDVTIEKKDGEAVVTKVEVK